MPEVRSSIASLFHYVSRPDRPLWRKIWPRDAPYEAFQFYFGGCQISQHQSSFRCSSRINIGKSPKTGRHSYLYGIWPQEAAHGDLIDAFGVLQLLCPNSPLSFFDSDQGRSCEP
jgi:hypothetical protein